MTDVLMVGAESLSEHLGNGEGRRELLNLIFKDL